MHFGPFLKIESQLYRIVATQALVVIIAAVLSLIAGLVPAYSTLLGGLVCVVPGFVAAKMIVVRTARQPGIPGAPGLGPVIGSELTRLGLSVVLFITTYTLVERLDVLFFFGTFIGLQLFYVAVPVVEARKLRKAMAGKKSG